MEENKDIVSLNYSLMSFLKITFRTAVTFRFPMDVFKLAKLTPLEYLVEYAQILPRKERIYKMVWYYTCYNMCIILLFTLIVRFGIIGRLENGFLPQIHHSECRYSISQQQFQGKFAMYNKFIIIIYFKIKKSFQKSHNRGLKC